MKMISNYQADIQHELDSLNKLFKDISSSKNDEDYFVLVVQYLNRIAKSPFLKFPEERKKYFWEIAQEEEYIRIKLSQTFLALGTFFEKQGVLEDFINIGLLFILNDLENKDGILYDDSVGICEATDNIINHILLVDFKENKDFFNSLQIIEENGVLKLTLLRDLRELEIKIDKIFSSFPYIYNCVWYKFKILKQVYLGTSAEEFNSSIKNTYSKMFLDFHQQISEKLTHFEEELPTFYLDNETGKVYVNGKKVTTFRTNTPLYQFFKILYNNMGMHCNRLLFKELYENDPCGNEGLFYSKQCSEIKRKLHITTEILYNNHPHVMLRGKIGSPVRN